MPPAELRTLLLEYFLPSRGQIQKKMKNLLTSLALIAIIGASMPSCKKVSPRKLDGKWKVTKATTTSSNEGSFSRIVTNITFDGTKETGTEVTTYTNGGNPDNVVIDRQVSFTWEFSKDDDTFVLTSTSSGIETDLDVSGFYYKDATGAYLPYSFIGQLDSKKSYTETEINKGVFSITGGAGDVDKNSQIVMKYNERNTTRTATIKYYNGSTEVTTPLYTAQFLNGNFVYNAAPTTENSTSSTTGERSSAVIVNVDELKGGVMDISYKEVENYTAGTNTSKFSVEYKATLEQE